MTRMAAEKVIQGLLTPSAALNETIRLVQTGAPSALPEFRKRAGEVRGAIYLDLIKPIVSEYSDLDPAADD